MLEQTVKYDANVVKLTPEEWTEFGKQMAVPLANAMKTHDHRISPSTDINFTPIPYPAGYIGPVIMIVVEEIGYPDRQADIADAVLFNLKDDFIRLFKDRGINLDIKKPLIRIKYDTEGRYF